MVPFTGHEAYEYCLDLLQCGPVLRLDGGVESELEEREQVVLKQVELVLNVLLQLLGLQQTNHIILSEHIQRVDGRIGRKQT